MPIVGAVLAGAAIIGGTSVLTTGMQIWGQKSAMSSNTEMMEKMYNQSSQQNNQFMNLMGTEMNNSNALQNNMMGTLYGNSSYSGNSLPVMSGYQNYNVSGLGSSTSGYGLS